MDKTETNASVFRTYSVALIDIIEYRIEAFNIDDNKNFTARMYNRFRWHS